MTPEDDAFRRARDKAFDEVIRHAEARVRPATLDDVHINIENDCWTLFARAFRHLKCGAPAGQPGSVAEALARASLRSSPFAASLGVKPPQFEQILLAAEYSSGREAALFLSAKLVEAAAADYARSRQALQQKILAEKPAEELKRQMALSCDVLAETYARVCTELKKALEEF